MSLVVCSRNGRFHKLSHPVFFRQRITRQSINHPLSSNNQRTCQKWCAIHLLHLCEILTESIQPLAIVKLNLSAEHERKQHKLKCLVQLESPSSYFMDFKCPGCFAITTVFSNAQSVVLCGSCASAPCQPMGGKARLTEGILLN
ncbi:hypothetical protein P692DRAFT_20742875 [Suillus brevipes Sb2]|nr:hypothetical protein P692DRAFT_20742875 [Suillus brevipes Sb2]